ncbi:MAG: rRNA pseudouridine synthase [Phycisphaerales bacterium]|nr:rRNA pseudouridine synthase [Phycisphaerales bacterium]
MDSRPDSDRIDPTTPPHAGNAQASQQPLAPDLQPLPAGWNQPEASAEFDRQDTAPDSADLRDASRGDRLQKVLAAAGIGSRRHCEALILEGKVTVNGAVVNELPAWAHPQRDRIEVDGRRIHGPAASVTVMLYKPRGVVCTNDDPEQRRRAVDLVQHPSRTRLFTVGRLDIDSSGLLLLTNDGALAQRLVHPSHNIEKVYEVLVRGFMSDDTCRTLLDGVFLVDKEGQKPRRARVKSIDLKMRDARRTRFEVVLGEGRNRQIRRMTAALGHPVKRLKRLSIGPLKLKGLQPSQWRELDRDELRRLRRAAHLLK